MHSGIVNGYQLLCDAHTVLEPHRGTTAFFFLFYSLLSFSSFSFYGLSLLIVLVLFLGTSIVCINNLKWTVSRFSLVIPWFVCTYPWHQNDLTVFTCVVKPYLTKLPPFHPSHFVIIASLSWFTELPFISASDELDTLFVVWKRTVIIYQHPIRMAHSQLLCLVLRWKASRIDVVIYLTTSNL